MIRPLAALLLLAAPALAAEQTVTLVPGPGLAQMEQNCSGCHSLDYVRMNAPFLNADGWKAEIAKMRGPYMASVDDEDAAKILAYLNASYGAGK